MPIIPLSSGYFSDTGYRFRYNHFERYDDWYPWSSSAMNEFYDILFYNSDTMIVDKNHKTIAEMYYRLEVD